MYIYIHIVLNQPNLNKSEIDNQIYEVYKYTFKSLFCSYSTKFYRGNIRSITFCSRKQKDIVK